jgi:hypothetical protein
MFPDPFCSLARRPAVLALRVCGVVAIGTSSAAFSGCAVGDDDDTFRGLAAVCDVTLGDGSGFCVEAGRTRSSGLPPPFDALPAPVRETLESSAGDFDLGSVGTGLTREIEFVLRNDGVGAITLDCAECGVRLRSDFGSGVEFFSLTPPPSARPITGNAAVDFSVAYSPLAPGAHYAILDIAYLENSADRRPSILSVNLLGRALAPLVEVCAETDAKGTTTCAGKPKPFGPPAATATPPVAPADRFTIDFGTLKPGAQDDRQITVTNGNTEPAAAFTVTSFELEQATAPLSQFDTATFTDATHFSFVEITDGSPIAAPVFVLPGEDGKASKTYTIRFRPSDPGVKLGRLRMETSDISVPRLDVILVGAVDSPKVCIRPADAIRLDFGQVDVDATSSKSFSVCSCGTKPLDISSLALDPASDPSFTVDPPNYSGTLDPVAADGTEDCVDVKVTYKPTAQEADTGKINVTSSDPVASEGFIDLVGVGSQPPGCILTAQPGAVDFGPVPFGKPTSYGEATFQLVNVGQKDCILTKIEGPTDPVFTIARYRVLVPTGDPANPFKAQNVAPPLPLPVSLGAGQSIDVTVQFRPTAQGTKNDNIRISDQQSGAQVTVPLGGTGAEPGACKLMINPAPLGTGANAAPSYLDFLGVPVGGSKTLPITFTHAADSRDVCTITTGVFGSGTDKAFSWGRSPKFPTKIQLGQKADFIIKYAPTSRGPPGVQGNPFCGIFGGSQVCGDNWVKFTSDAANEPTIAASGGGGGTPCTFPGFPPGCSSGGGSSTASGKGWFVTLNGEGVTDSFECLPGEVKFPLTTTNCNSATQTVTCYNKGQTSVEVTKWETDPTPPFSILATSPLPSSPGQPITLAPGASMAIQLRYRPSKPLTQESGVLRVFSPAVNNQAGAFEIPLTAAGTTGAAATDTFDQLESPVVDVLWAIDNSGSMAEEQVGLAANVPLFTSYAASLRSDFHIGVTTSEINDAYTADTGACRGNVAPGWLYYCPGTPKWVEPTTPNLASVLGNNLRPGTCCSDSQEAVLEAAKLVFTEPNLSDPGINGGFLRPEARLVTIFVTDEIDQSDSPVDYYVDFFRRLKGGRGKDQFSATIITGLDSKTLKPAACSSANGDAEDGSRLYEFWQKVGNGLAISICDTNWAANLNRLALDVFIAQTSFPLSRPGDPATINVTLNGQPIPRDTTNSGVGWTYDLATNTVTFGRKTIPTKGSRIEVRYNAVCF